MKHAIYTIGYEGSGIEDFVETLKANDVSLLVDIRDFPGSRKKGFSKSVLAAILRFYGIEYVHLKGLGDPREGREAARAGDYSRFRRVFESHLRTTGAKSDMARAVELVDSAVACLLCYERDHLQCHRSIVAARLAEETGRGVRNLRVRHGVADADNYADIPQLAYA